MAPLVVVFIPALNEEESIGGVIRRIAELYGAGEAGFRVQTIVVDDGSTDRTGEVALAAGAVAIARHPYNRGLGAATRTGMQRAYEMGADVAVKIDADFQHDPEDIAKVVAPILEDRADAVFGSRFAGQINYAMPRHRRWGNAFFTFLTSQITGLKVTDAQTGLMAFGRRYLKVFDIASDYNETQQLIIDAWGKHFRVVEEPVVFHARTTGRSFISLRYPFRVLPAILRTLVRANPLRVFVPPGVILVLLGLLTGVAVAFDFAPPIVGDATIVILLVGGFQMIMLGLLADLGTQRR